jgi:hypothetical protein
MSEESVDDLINQLERLRIQEATILRRLVAARARETRRTEEDAEDGTFRVGGRVEITDRVRITFGRNVNIDDRRAIITRITPTRIYFRTVNGHTTWRAESNLRLVPRNETW